MIKKEQHYCCCNTKDKMPAAIKGPTGTPRKMATPMMVPSSKPVTNKGCALIKPTPRPPSHATTMPTATAASNCQLVSMAIKLGTFKLPEASGANTPMVRMMMPMLRPFFCIHGRYYAKAVCRHSSNTQAAMVMEVLWLKTPRPIKATNTNELLSNCRAGMMGCFKKKTPW